MSESNEVQQQDEEAIEAPEPQYNVTIKENTQKTVFINVFELQLVHKDGGEPIDIIYTRYHNESKMVPGIPEALPSSYSVADSDGNSVVYKPDTHFDVLYSIESAVNKHVELNNEKLKQGALELAKAEDNSKNDNDTN